MNAVLQETQEAIFKSYTPASVQTEGTQTQEVQPKAQSLNIKLRADVFATLDEYCKEEGLSKEEVAADLIREYIEDYIEGERYDKSCVEEVESIIAEVEAGRMKTYTLDEVKEELGL